LVDLFEWLLEVTCSFTCILPSY